MSLTAGRSVGQVSDRSGWYNIYWAAAAGDVCLKAMDAEFAGPMWALGGQAFHFLADGSLLCGLKRPGDAGNTLAVLEPLDGTLTPVPVPYTQFGGAAVAPSGAVAVTAASFDKATELLLLDTAGLKEGAFESVKQSSTAAVSKLYLSEPQALEFPTDGDRSAWMLFYPPTNGLAEGPPGSKPPLLVKSHGGPTASTSAALNLAIQARAAPRAPRTARSRLSDKRAPRSFGRPAATPWRTLTTRVRRATGGRTASASRGSGA